MNQDPLASATVQAAIEQAERMGALEAEQRNLGREIGQLRQDLFKRLDTINRGVDKTNGSVAQAIRDRDDDRRRMDRIEEKAGTAEGMAVEALAAVKEIEDVNSGLALAQRDKANVSKGRLDVLRAQWRAISLGFVLAGGPGLVAYLLEWRPF